MNLLKVIILLINFISVIYMLYYLFFAMFAFKKSKNKLEENGYKKFGILIPARNEELVVGNLIQSLNNQNYPKDKYDIFVAPNNCDDNTEEVAIKFNSTNNRL